MNKTDALVNFLNVEPKDVFDFKNHVTNEHMFCYKAERYLILTNDEAQNEFKTKLKDYIYKVPTRTILKFLDLLNSEYFFGIISSIQSFGKDSNSILIKLIGDNYDKLASYVVFNSNLDRGKFLAKFDGLEIQQSDFFIYRLS